MRRFRQVRCRWCRARRYGRRTDPRHDCALLRKQALDAVAGEFHFGRILVAIVGDEVGEMAIGREERMVHAAVEFGGGVGDLAVERDDGGFGLRVLEEFELRALCVGDGL